MHIGSALWRIARPTIACSSLELNIHLAASSVSPRHCTCTVSNAGVEGRAIFSMTDADADAEVAVDAEDLVRVRECECACQGICGDTDVGRLLLASSGGVVAARVGGMASLCGGGGASCSLRLIVGLRGPMGKVRSRRENVEDAELIGTLRDGVDLNALLTLTGVLVSVDVLGRSGAEAGSGAIMVDGGAAAAAVAVAGAGGSSDFVISTGLNECGVWGNMLSLRSLGGGGGFVLIAWRTGLVPSMDLSDDVSDLLPLLDFIFCSHAGSITVKGGMPLLLPAALAAADEDADDVGGKLPKASTAPGADDSGILGRRSCMFLAGAKAVIGGASLTLRVRKWPLSASETVRACDVFDAGCSSGEGATVAAVAVVEVEVVVGRRGGEAVEGLRAEAVDELHRPVTGVVPW